MKKVLLILVLILTLSFTGIKAETNTRTYTLESVAGVGYDLEIGKAINDPLYLSTKKETLSYYDYGTLDLTSLTWDYLLFFDDNNRLIGYYWSNGDIYTDKDLGEGSLNITPPQGSKTFSFMNYNYGSINDFITLSVSLDYEYEPHEFNINTSINNILDNIGFNSPIYKIFLGITLMIVVSVGMAFFVSNNLYILIVDALLFIVFTFLGWFSLWILIVISIVLFVLIFLKIGGNK